MLNPFEERWFFTGACAFASGIFWAADRFCAPEMLVLLLIFVLCAKLGKRLFAVFAAFLCLGMAAMSIFSLTYSAELLSGGITGVVAAYPVKSDSGDTVIILRDCAANGVEFAGKVRVYCEKPPDKLQYGNRVSFEGKLTAPNPRMNPHTQSAKLAAWSKGIRYNANAETLTSGGEITPMTYVMRLREAMESSLCELIGERYGMVRGIMFGDTSEMDENELQSFRDAGISHLLAVSGLHTGIIAGALYWLLKRLKLRGFAALLPTIAGIALYAALTGFTPSVVRAGIMLSLGLAARELGECVDTANTAGCAALVIMLGNPAALFSLSFQLSFSAVLGIAFFSGQVTKLLTLGGRLRDRFGLAGIAGVTLSAQLGTLLIQLCVFGTATPLALIANLIALPFVSAALISALIAAIAGCFFQPLGWLCSRVCAAALIPIEFAGNVVAKMPFARIVTGAPNAVFVAAAIVAFAAISCYCVKKRVRRALLVFSLTLLCAAAALASADRAQTSVAVLYVGNSDAAVVRHKKSTVMIDAGTAFESYSSGSAVIAPYLRGEGLSRLDAVILTHPHNDHYGGLWELAGEVEIGRVIIPQGTSDADFGGLLSFLERRGIPVEKAENGGKITEGRLSFDVLQVDPNAEGDENRQSLVLLTELCGRRALFMGDADMTCERELLGKIGNCDILKVGHHGAKTGTTQAFLNEVRPRLAIISVGINNRYGHPSGAVVDKLEDNGAIALRTDERGCVTLKFNENAVKAYCEVEQ